MSEVGLNENIVIGERVFHIQTSTNIASGLIKAEVFESGRLLNTMYRKYEKRKENIGANTRVKKLVETFHKSIIKNINNIFNIAKTIRKENDVFSHLKIGILFYSLNLYSEAVEHLTIVCSLDEKCQLAHKYLIKIALKAKNVKQAQEFKNKLVIQKNKFADVFNVIGLVEYYSSKYIDSIKAFKKAIALNPNYLVAYVNLLMVFIKSYEKVDKSINTEEQEKKYSFLNKLFKKAEEALKNNYKENRYLEVKLDNISENLKKRDYKKMFDLLKKIHIKLFNEIDSYRILGYEIFLRVKYDLNQLSHYEISLYEENINKILKDHPEYSDLWNVLGLIYIVHTKNLFNISLENFDNALALNESYKSAMKNRKLVENDGKELITVLNSMLN